MFKNTLCLASIAALSTVAWADVHGYAVAKSVGYTQTSDAEPASPDSWLFTAGIYYETGEVSTAAISFVIPPSVQYDMYQATTEVHQYYSALYGTEAELDTDYPSTTYTVTIDRGAGLETGDVFLAAGLYPAQVPHFTSGTYDALQNIDPALAFNGTVSPFTIAGGTDYGATYVTVAQEFVGGLLTLTLDPADTEFEIPAGLLQPNTNYSIGVSHWNVVQTFNAAFGTALATAEFSRGTIVYFTTMPDVACVPCDVDCNGTVNPFDIQPFIDLLSGGGACSPCAGDTDVNGTVNPFDIQPFIDCLAG